MVWRRRLALCHPRDEGMSMMKYEPSFVPHGDPRWGAMLSRLGWPIESRSALGMCGCVERGGGLPALMTASVLWHSLALRGPRSLPGPPALYALTRICSVEYIKIMESVFEIIAEPNRRAILSLLVSSQQSVGEIERQLRMPQPTVSKHLRVLREAGFVESTVDAQRRLYRLKPEPLQEVDAWLARFRRFWSAHVDALERHLDHMHPSTPRKRKTRRKR